METHLEKDKIPAGYLRVTQVLSPFTRFDGIDPLVLAKAADRGTRAHKFCTMYALNLLVVDVDEDCKGYVESFKQWFDDNVVRVLMASNRLNSSQLRLSGELDLVCLLKGDCGPTLIDIKTPANEASSWQLQTAAYMILLRDVLQYQVDRRMSLMLPRDGNRAKVVEYTSHINDQAMYLDALKLYRFFNG